ncbi:MAG: hypothetical protein ACKVH8_06170 [Pirellulales bacterium]
MVELTRQFGYCLASIVLVHFAVFALSEESTESLRESSVDNQRVPLIEPEPTPQIENALLPNPDRDKNNFPIQRIEFIEEILTPPLPVSTQLNAPEIKPIPSYQLPGPNQEKKHWSYSSYFSSPTPDQSVLDDIELPSLEEELWLHGGSHLYAAEGDEFQYPTEHDPLQHERLRLPEDYRTPQPLTLFSKFLGNDPIRQSNWHWFGTNGYNFEKRFTAYGSYEISGIGYQENGIRQDGLGHQLLLELDYRWTGTERFHVQFRPLGGENSGGSFYQLNAPVGYIDNSTGEPQRYWFEGELASIFGGYFSPFAVRDVFITGGKFPFALHNSLLMNDEIIGAAINKNTLFWGRLSNLNIQAIVAPGDIDNTASDDATIYGLHATADYARSLYELSYFYVDIDDLPGRDQHFIGFSKTKLRGSRTSACRALFKLGDEQGIGSGQLFVYENNWMKPFDSKPCGIEYAVPYCNLFFANDGWNTIAGGNFNRLRAAFSVDPLVSIASGRSVGENYGASLGVQFFRHHEDESFTPEIAFEAPNGDPIWATGFQYQRKTSKRTFFEILGVLNFSDIPEYRRQGIYVSETILF